MDYIKIGSISFRVASLKGMTLKDAKTSYPTIDERLVKRAWEIVNPKRTSKKKSGKK